MKMKWMNYLLAIISFSICQLSIANNNKRILFISSYNSSFPTFFEQIEGIKSVIDSIDVELDLEFMDSKRFAGVNNTNAFYQSISYKIKHLTNYSVVMTSDDNALNFVLKNQNNLFKNIPIVFCGVNNRSRALEQNTNEWVTGVIESVSMKETIELMLKLFPNSDEIYSLSDATITGQNDLKYFYEYKTHFKSTKFKNLSLNDFTYSEFPQKLKQINRNTPVLLLSSLLDSTNKHLSFHESLSVINKNLSPPLFHLYYHGMGKGILGGKLISHFEQGKCAALIAKDILLGKNISDIKVIDKSPNQYIFDFKELKKHNIDLSLLPKDSRLINHPETFFSKYKTELFWILVFIITQTVLIIYLLASIRMKKKVQTKLKNNVQDYLVLNEEYQSLNIEYEAINEDLRLRNNDLLAAEEELRTNMEELALKQDELEISEERFRLALLATDDGLWDWNLKNNEVYYSTRWKSILGYKDNELSNELDTWINQMHKEDIDESMDKVQSFIDGTLDRYEVEFRMKHKEGWYVPILSKGFMMRNHKGNAYRIIGTHQDLTKQHKAEEILKEKIEENLSLYEEYRTISEELYAKNNDLLAIEEELRANNEELHYNNQKLSESEERYRLLFENLNEGFALHEIVIDHAGKPIDYIFREVNPVFLERIGLNYEDIINKSALDLFPKTEQNWIDHFAKVALTGESTKITDYSVQLNKYYETYLFSPKKGFFAGIFNDITESTLAKKALIAEKEKINNILKGTNAGTWDWNVQDSTLELNERWAEMLGYNLKELKPVGAELWLNLTHKDDIKLANKTLTQLKNKEIKYYDIEIRQKHKKGHWVWLHSRGNIVARLEDGSPARMSGTYIDISDKKEAELKLIDQRDKYSDLNKMYEQVIQGAQIGTFERFISTDTVLRNKVAVDMLGYSLKEMGHTNAKWMSLIHPDDLDNTTFGCAITKDSDVRNFDITYRMKHKKGHWIWIQCKGNVSETDNQGTPLKVSGITMDITNKKEAELILQKKEENFRLLFNYTIEGILIHDNGIIVNANNAFVKLFGYDSLKTFIGNKLPFHMINPEYQDIIKDNMLSKKCGKLEIKATRLDGSLIDIEIETHNITFQNREMRLVAARDISDQKRNKQIADSRIAILNKANESSYEHIMVKALDEIEKISNSKIGFFHFVNHEKKTLSLQAWSTSTSSHFCQINNMALHYDVAQAGVWADCIREGKAIIHNDYNKLQHKKGLPQGHSPIIRQLLIPIIRDKKVVAALGVGNNPVPYTSQDLKLVEQLADLTWDIVDRKRKELELIDSEKRFKTIFDKSKTIMALIDPITNTIVDANDSALKFYGYSKEEFIQVGPFGVSCEGNEEVKSRIKSALNEEKDYFETKHVLNSGEIRNVNVFTTPIKANNKELVHVIIIDTTQAVEAKYQIQQINQRFIGLDKIIHYSANSINDLLDYTLNQVIDYTQSDIGAIYHYDIDKNIFHLNNWSDDIELTFQANSDILNANQLDCLSRSVIQKKPIIINNPEGKYPFVQSEKLNDKLLKSISIPIVANNHVVAIVWLASTHRLYSTFHAEQVMLLLDTTWILVEKQRLQDMRN